MAEINSFSEINDNFDTVKTLLNSIRAQGILNTSDVDKLLSGINAKLEKINTEEDIDIIKAFLTELKQTLDSRHDILISKFGAIEALFSNLLKNSNDLPKSSELKELFDVVATNLSVFSREVVSQKETLTDITMRLDAIRSDDSQKKDIIKNITLLKPDLERLNNGFDTIVLSLNDNFKTIVKTISTIDKTEYLEKFSGSLNNIEMSANTLLSAIQVLDKKAEGLDSNLQNLATKNDMTAAGRSLEELKVLNAALNDSVGEVNLHYSKIDDLAEKIDASVNIIANLKAVLEDIDDKNSKIILEKLEDLSSELGKVNNDAKFEDFKVSMSSLLKDIADSSALLDQNLNSSSEEIKKIIDLLSQLDIKTSITDMVSRVDSSKEDIKEYINENTQKIMTLGEANVSRVLSDISSSTDALNSRLNLTQSEIASLCENRFGTVFANIEDLKKVVSQIDDNGVSSYNAMFSNITDRLNMFENMLKDSLESQENSSNTAISQLSEQVDNIKNVSGVIDYKMDSSVIEISNMTRTFETLKSSVDGILSLDFVNTVKDLRADLYASKQEMSNNFENSSNELSEKILNDLFGKYELLISKLDSVEEEFVKTQKDALYDVKEVMDRISSSIVDIISYVSVQKTSSVSDEINKKFDDLASSVGDVSLNYVENVRDVVDVIRVQVENNLRAIEEDSSRKFVQLEKVVGDKTVELKSDIKESYNKILEVQEAYKELKELLNENNLAASDRFVELSQSAKDINTEFESKLGLLKTNLIDKIDELKQNLTCENSDGLNEIRFAMENLQNKHMQTSSETINQIKEQISAISTADTIARNDSLEKVTNTIDNLRDICNTLIHESKVSNDAVIKTIADNFEGYDKKLGKLASDIVTGRNQGIGQIFDKIESVKELAKNLDSQSSDKRSEALAGINLSFEKINGLVDEFKVSSGAERAAALEKITGNFEEIKNTLEKFIYDSNNARTSALAKILDDVVGVKDYAATLSDKTEGVINERTQVLVEMFGTLQSTLNKVDENIDSDMTRQLSIIESNFESLISQMSILFDKTDKTLADRINEEFSDISERLNSTVAMKLETYKTKIEETFDRLGNRAEEQSSYLQERIADINTTLKAACETQAEANMQQISDAAVRLKSVLEEHIGLAEVDYVALKDKVNEFATDVKSNNELLVGQLKVQLDDITKYIDSILDIQVQETGSKFEDLSNVLSKSVSEVSERTDKLSSLVEEQIDGTKSAQASISDLSALVASTNAFLGEIEKQLDNKTSELTYVNTEIANKQVATIEEAAGKLLEQIELCKNSVTAGKDFVVQFVEKEMQSVSANIEKETDVIFAELVEQFDNMKKSQSDESVKITNGIEAMVTDCIYSNIEDLKSYLDVKTDNIVLSDKLDNLKIEMAATFDETMKTLNKMLQADAFTTSISDFRVANEILVNSAADKLNEDVERFVRENATDILNVLTGSSKNIEDKLALFDKKFIDTIVDKFEEIKLLSNTYNKSIDDVQGSLDTIISDFGSVKETLGQRIDNLSAIIQSSTDEAKGEIKELQKCFDNLRTQISSKSFDEAFQASINKQIASLEGLIQEQLSYIEDINEICAANLPDIPELSAVVKNSVIKSINEFSYKIDGMEIDEKFAGVKNKIDEMNLDERFAGVKNKIDEMNLDEKFSDVEDRIEDEFKSAKSEIITQILNIFNQISFVTEQEEILDFIQDKHDELISVLSHMVKATDNNLLSVKSEIDLLNDKINSIIASDGDIDYIYSLQDLESDIANLRLVLQSIQDNNNNAQVAELAESAGKIYKLLETVRESLPDKTDFEDLAEDIVSISTRTNRLLLASDETYKTLQDNLQEFKLVINDLDERTKNFARESGMDRIDSKLNALNTMFKNGEKTNQTFNQVFEYLAEWVDKAGVRIDEISNKVETLDDIEQIKTMLMDLKATSEDDTEGAELVEALSTVFDKQAKKISSLETKLDKMIVASTINNNKLDIAKMEDTLNKFLVTVGDKITTQQSKIEKLESKLENVLEVIDDKSTAQLTKKVGGMDKQIAKLNKSIEKIASHVIEK